MNPTALIVMLTTFVVVTLVTGYFFFRVLITPAKPEPDSYSEQEDGSGKSIK